LKTTLNLDDRLLTRAKALAAREGTTLTAIVEDALRARLATKPRAQPAIRLTFPTVKGIAPPGVDIADRDALFDVLDADAGAER
jgi:hypothetical protein